LKNCNYFCILRSNIIKDKQLGIKKHAVPTIWENTFLFLPDIYIEGFLNPRGCLIVYYNYADKLGTN